jgi:hypothetical protein
LRASLPAVDQSPRQRRERRGVPHVDRPIVARRESRSSFFAAGFIEGAAAPVVGLGVALTPPARERLCTCSTNVRRTSASAAVWGCGSVRTIAFCPSQSRVGKTNLTIGELERVGERSQPCGRY